MRNTLTDTHIKHPFVFMNSINSVNEDNLCHLAFDNSLQASIIAFPGCNGKILLVNSAACKLLGYSKMELLTKRREAIFDTNENSFKKMLKQRMAEGHSTALVSMIKKNGRRILCEISSVIFKGKDDIENAIITITDMSQSIRRQNEIDARNKKLVVDNIALVISNQKNIDTRKEKIAADNIILAKANSEGEKLDNEINSKAEYEKNFKLIFNSSSDILCDDDLITNQVILSGAYEKKFGYKINNNTTSMADLFSHIHPEDKEALMLDYQRMLASEDTEWKYNFRFKKADDSIANIFTSGIVLRNAAGKAYRRIGYMQDISKQKVLEEKLDMEIKLKEKQIAEASEEAKETERSNIGKELHDNVNQLLSASRLYLEMAKQGGENSEMFLSRSSEYTVTAIEEIRKLTRGLTTSIIKNLGLCEAIENIARDAMEVNPVKLFCALETFKEDGVGDKFKLNVYRIIQEQLSNILKYAKATEVIISLLQNKKIITLSVSDNGVGFDTGKKRNGIGIINIKNRAASYNGSADFVSQPGMGCVLKVTFPVPDAQLNKNGMLA